MVTIAWGSGMVWWLSSSVCSFTLISRLYADRELLSSRKIYIPLGILVSFIFLAMMLFGIMVVYDLGLVEDALFKVFSQNCEIFDIPSIEHIFALVKKLYLLSTSTLLSFLLIWIYIWFYGKPKQIPPKP